MGTMSRLLSAGVGAAVGATAALLLDPEPRPRTACAARSIAVPRSGAVRCAAASARLASRGPGLPGKADAIRSLGEPAEWANDATLKERVESELLGDPKVPKGTININAEQGIVVLRGEVPTRQMREKLATRAGEIEGVWYVENLLHLPGEPAPTVR